MGPVAPPRVPARPRHRRRQGRRTRVIGAILGGHGITAWGDTSEEAEANSLRIIRTASAYIAEHGRPEPFGPALEGFTTLPEEERRAKAAALAPHLRAIASHDRPQVGHFTDSAEVLDFLASTEHPRLAALGTSCPDHFLRTKVKPLLVDLPATASVEEILERLPPCTRRTAPTTRPTTTRTRRRRAPRSAAPIR